MPGSQKTYIYRVYDESNNFVGVWDKDIASEFALGEEINSAGSQVTVKLARPANDFGEGVTVDFNFKVKIYAVDAGAPNGTLVFTGYISNYVPVWGQDEINITLLGYGADLGEYMIHGGASVDNATTDGAISPVANSGFSYYYVAQTFTLTEQTRINSVELFMNELAMIGFGNYLEIHSGTPIDVDSLGVPEATLVSQHNFADSTGHEVCSFLPEGGPIVLAAGTYFVLLTPGGDPGVGASMKVMNSSNQYSGGASYHALDEGSDPTQVFTTTFPGTINGAYDLWFRINAGTTQAYYSMDPSDILRSILDIYAQQGGVIDYDINSIDDTGTLVTYTFNANTVFEGIKKVLELAPVDWYWYVDQATNLLHFHRKSASLDRSFVLGKDIITISPRKTIENMVNKIYFLGGGEPPLYRQYSHEPSIALYGQKMLLYIDQRVTNQTTADTIAKSILDQRNAPEIQLEFEIVDSNVDPVNGYDLESLVIGETVGLRATGGSGESLWDVARWDEDYWDYNAQDIGTALLQAVRIERTASTAKIFCSTVPPDVNKRIEDINRNLEASQTVEAPSSPE